MSTFDPRGPSGGGLPSQPVQPSDPSWSGAHVAGGPVDTDEQRSLGDIVGDIATDLTTLIKQELELAKTEAKDAAVKAGKGAGMFGGAGVAALLMLISLTLTLIWLLDGWMPREVAALIVTVVWAVIAGVLALRGRTEIKQMNPPLETTQKTLKEDVQWAKAQKNS
ncbi:MAG: phage holin family protein [Nocardioidaceae bacterium]